MAELQSTINVGNIMLKNNQTKNLEFEKKHNRT